MRSTPGQTKACRFRIDRDRGCLTGRPSHTTGHTGHVPRRFVRLRLGRDIETGETEWLEVMVAQGLLDRRVS